MLLFLPTWFAAAGFPYTNLTYLDVRRNHRFHKRPLIKNNVCRCTSELGGLILHCQ